MNKTHMYSESAALVRLVRICLSTPVLALAGSVPISGDGGTAQAVVLVAGGVCIYCFLLSSCPERKAGQAVYR